jgi:hypothetical protein
MRLFSTKHECFGVIPSAPPVDLQLHPETQGSGSMDDGAEHVIGALPEWLTPHLHLKGSRGKGPLAFPPGGLIPFDR